MTGVNLSELFESFTRSAFRLECLQTYDVSDETESFRAFQEGLPRPERSVRTNTYLQSVARAALAGKSWDRVRIVSYPLTTYTRYELLGYRENQAAGEQVHLVSQNEFARLHPSWDQDFWLFDSGWDTVQAVLLRYGPQGTFIGLEPVTDRDRVRELEHVAFDLVRHTIPLNEFIIARAPAAGV